MVLDPLAGEWSRRRLLVGGSLLLAGSLSAGGTDRAVAGRRAVMTPDLLLARYARVQQTAPGAPRWLGVRRVVFDSVECDPDDPSGAGDRHVVESVDVAKGRRTRLAEGRHPAPSPDGRQVAFLGVDGQLWTVAADGGRPRALTEEPGGVAAYGASWSTDFVAWSPDSRRLAFAVAGAVRLVAVGDGRTTTPVDGDGQVTGMDWHPEGDRLVVGRLDESDAPGRRTLFVVSVRSGSVRVLATDRGIYPLQPRVAPDGRLVAFAHEPFAYNPGWGCLAVVPTEGGSVRRLTGDRYLLASDGSVGTGMWHHRWMPDGRSLLVTMKTGVFERVGRVSLDGRMTFAPTRRTRTAERAEPVADGRLMVYHSRDAHGVRQVRVAGVDGGPDRAVVDLDPGVTGGVHARQVSWRAPDGLALSGLLVTPRGPAGGRPRPMVVDVHGGPDGGLSLSGSLLNSGPLEWHLWAARGYAVFVADYRSSMIPGRKPYEELVADREFLARDATDIDAGVRALVRRGVADPSRLALVGHSWGGVLAAWIAANPNHYRAMVAKAFFADFTTAYAMLCPRGRRSCPELLLHHYFGGSPAQVPDVYRANAAVHHVAGPGGAVLLVSTDAFTADDNTEFRDELRRIKDGPTRLVRYRDENHVVRDPANQRDLLHRTLTLFDEHLGRA